MVDLGDVMVMSRGCGLNIHGRGLNSWIHITHYPCPVCNQHFLAFVHARGSLTEVSLPGEETTHGILRVKETRLGVQD